ncbi:MAG: metallophosphoesterase family protein [Blastocatellia bacterium]
MSAQPKLQPSVAQTENEPASLFAKPQKKWVSWKKKRMVGWYNPIQLLKTGRDVFISTIFGRHFDRRLVEALTADEAEVFDYRGHFRQAKMKEYAEKGRSGSDRESRDEIWIDYVSDVGDGWNSTYGVAYWLAQDELRLKAGNGKDGEYETRRGDVLIFGGDEVYPVADGEEYDHRLVKPYRDALDRIPEEKPQVYAIPGNHDWYDSLSAFTSLFCDEKTSHFAGGRWEAPQNRSYFALRLPGKWWLIGIDLQLSSDLDAIQIQYFQKMADQMEEGDRVILCSPEPYWVYQIGYGENDENKGTRLSRGYLEKHFFEPRGVKVGLYLAGDLHHYFHITQKGAHKITVGGGGAFMHPTHGPFGRSFDLMLRKSKEEGKVHKRYPEIEDSRRVAWRNLLFPFLNPLFGIVTAILYTLAAWSIMALIQHDGNRVETWAMAWEKTLRAATETPVAGLWAIAILAGFWLFTDTASTLYRYIGGFVHGAIHVSMVFLIGWGAYFQLGWDFNAQTELAQIWKWIGLVALGGYFFGALVMGLYLLISINVFGRHSTEAFSSLRIQDWKNFLRIKIDKEGTVTIFPIGIRRAPRKWRERLPHEKSVSKYQPVDGSLVPELIEEPIIIH